ncbi:hypothetical protein VPH35_073289 [Triticum aestivum]|uniref:uncharacterized protein isoform X2 n=1 Tax=Triticum aestivum TaxID=4565 RepID=UPI001D00597A|nr:uncharacterized protein LOC123092347 isoform X2 [Triticum aestivum]
MLGEGARAVATHDTTVSVSPLVRTLAASFDEYGSHLGSPSLATMVEPELSGDLGGAFMASPVANGGGEAGCVLNVDSAPTPPFGRHGSGGSGRPPKKPAGRKPAAKACAAAASEELRGDLGEVLVSVGAGAKAKRSKATPVPQRPERSVQGQAGRSFFPGERSAPHRRQEPGGLRLGLRWGNHVMRSV